MIMATVDSERYVTVEFNSTTTAVQIRELILSRVSLLMPSSTLSNSWILVEHL